MRFQSGSRVVCVDAVVVRLFIQVTVQCSLSTLNRDAFFFFCSPPFSFDSLRALHNSQFNHKVEFFYVFFLFIGTIRYRRRRRRTLANLLTTYGSTEEKKNKSVYTSLRSWLWIEENILLNEFVGRCAGLDGAHELYVHLNLARFAKWTFEMHNMNKNVALRFVQNVWICVSIEGTVDRGGCTASIYSFLLGVGMDVHTQKSIKWNAVCTERRTSETSRTQLSIIESIKLEFLHRQKMLDHLLNGTVSEIMAIPERCEQTIMEFFKIKSENRNQAICPGADSPRKVWILRNANGMSMNNGQYEC